jgi:hypothetical protein
MRSTERGLGGWPVDPQLAFFEAQSKFHEAWKEAVHWRSNHAQLLRRLKAAQTYRVDLDEGATLLKLLIARRSSPEMSGRTHRQHASQ